jgi:hypothetical protein
MKIDRIAQLEALLERENSWDENIEITILPNGEIQARTDKLPDIGNRKPLTFRENLGGEYVTP